MIILEKALTVQAVDAFFVWGCLKRKSKALNVLFKDSNWYDETPKFSDEDLNAYDGTSEFSNVDSLSRDRKPRSDDGEPIFLE